MHSRHRLVSSLSASLLALAASNAYAQQTPPTEQPQTTTTDDDEESTGDIIVTGSRIPRAGFDTLEPATVIDEDYIEERGLTNVADALNEIPGFGVPTSPSGDQAQFASSANFVNFYGLGTQRTLTLVNGRRVVSANAPLIISGSNPGVQVDLNTITSQLVERIETISVGGAPTYGSDAIAGTTNVILKRNFEGLETQLTNGISDYGDGRRFNASALFGHNFGDRGNITLSASYDKQDGVRQLDRDYLAEAYFFALNPRGATVEPGRTPQNDGRVNPTPFAIENFGVPDGVPDLVLIRDSRIQLYNTNGVILPITFFPTTAGKLIGFGPNRTTYFQFAPGGDIQSYDPGYNFGSFSASGGQGYFPLRFSQVTSDIERRSISALGHYKLTDSVEAFFEAQYYSAEAFEVADSGDTNCCLSATGVSGSITFEDDYPLLNEQARSVLAANNITRFRLSRSLADIINAATSSESEMIRGVVGLRGDFAIGDRSFNWEASANLGRYKTTYNWTQLNQQNYVNAINVTRDASGNVVCSPTAVDTVFYGPTSSTEFQPVADPACVPLNLFGEGTASPEAIAYVTDLTQGRSRQEQQVYNFNVTGSPFDIWSGPVSMNVGFEHRREAAEFIPDMFQREALGRNIAIEETRGSFHTNEVFGEVLVPLIDPDSDIPLLKRFDLTGKVRYVHSNINGGYFAYTAGAQWRPFESFEIRGNYTRSLRAPAITELFTPASEIGISVTDPCRASQLNLGVNPEIRQRNCTALTDALGVPTPFNPAQPPNLRGTQSGDPNLENETSRAFSIGAVWEPTRNLTLSVDYIEIEIDNVIALLTANNIAEGCYDDPGFDVSNPLQGNQYCELITRSTENGAITFVDQRYVNGEFLNFSGISANALYRLDLGNYGRLSFNANLFSPQRYESSNTGITIDERIGERAFSKTQIRAGIGYDIGPVGLTWQTRYIGDVLYDKEFTFENQDVLRIDDYFLHNAGLRVQVADRGELRFAVTNVFNTPPPPQAFGGYDVLGRRYSVTAEWRF